MSVQKKAQKFYSNEFYSEYYMNNNTSANKFIPISELDMNSSLSDYDEKYIIIVEKPCGGTLQVNVNNY